MKNVSLVIVGISLLLCIASSAQAVNTQIEGVRFDREYRQGDVVLPLQGTGLFRYLGLIKKQLLGPGDQR